MRKQANSKVFRYQAEVDRVLDMIVNSLYSNKDVFLRELVSNASDALDKARFVAIERPEILFIRKELEIRIRPDEFRNVFVIEDDGIGMTRSELINNLGTIASSGTAKFVQAVSDLRSSEQSCQIGQFGVGFYSSFLVASEVIVQSRHPDSKKQWVWQSVSGAGSYKVFEDGDIDLLRGTRITLNMREDSTEYFDTLRVRGLISQYSEFIAFPIKLWQSDDKDIQVIDEKMTNKRQEFENRKASQEGRVAGQVQPVLQTR